MSPYFTQSQIYNVLLTCIQIYRSGGAVDDLAFNLFDHNVVVWGALDHLVDAVC